MDIKVILYSSLLSVQYNCILKIMSIPLIKNNVVRKMAPIDLLDTGLPQTLSLFKKNAISNKHNKIRYACIHMPQILHRVYLYKRITHYLSETHIN